MYVTTYNQLAVSNSLVQKDILTDHQSLAMVDRNGLGWQPH